MAPSGGRHNQRTVRAQAPVRHGRQSSPNPVVTLVKALGMVLVVTLVSGATVAGLAAYTTLTNIKPGIHLEHAAGSTVAPPPSVGAAEGAVNLLLAGSDTRTGQSSFQDKADLASSSGLGNNDVTMLLHVSADHTNATVVSFPRDLVSVPICGNAISSAMLNTTLARGLSCTVQTIEKMSGLTIPYAGVIKFDGVIGMSNAVGGVSVCLATPVKDDNTYPPLDLAAGQQNLVGGNALSFLRSRHGVGDGSDLGRISNQQVFLSALARKITSDGTLNNPITLFTLANAALSNMQLSDTLTNPTSLVSIALTLKKIPLDRIVFVQYPVTPDPSDPNRVIPQPSSAEALVSALKSDRPLSLTGKLGRAATAAATPTASPTPSASPTIAPEATTTPTATSVPLPGDISGQNASQSTCTAKNK
ncbi:LytR family transcriptional regulator [Cryobacterium algoritolerans]|uniref:LytR family transcriptional regulator n=1 Tax=Cryobacterium algoritolerans TaxID=1259184 RepID=A0A4R8WS88_9MICO|nr:LytR family transcriptional regulator [Cryobacterium algoritolerans]